ncbi:four helix bundle protein [Candidatus Zixiibacteriota bacterium]
MSVSSFKDLDVWKKGVDIVEHIYNLSKRFPKEEKYGLVSQVQRAAVSIPSKIAEGFARCATKRVQEVLSLSPRLLR